MVLGPTFFSHVTSQFKFKYYSKQYNLTSNFIEVKTAPFSSIQLKILFLQLTVQERSSIHHTTARVVFQIPQRLAYHSAAAFSQYLLFATLTAGAGPGR
jgi:hypothetical protein